MKTNKTFQAIEEMRENPDGSVDLRFVIIVPSRTQGFGMTVYEKNQKITSLDLTQNSERTLKQIKANNAMRVFSDFYQDNFLNLDKKSN